MNEQIKEFNASMEFKIAREKKFSVIVKSWLMCDKWQYNVYAYIAEDHKLFKDVESAMNLPFNCGCTYDAITTTTPARGIQYDHQKEYKTLVVGSDYAHIYDNYNNHSSPLDAIPHEVLSDAKELVSALEKE